ncbi:MAG: glycoside hydrolase family 13 protein [Rhodothermaceae bacterium]|nr:glycoside hydrolase family 13 protein [Rhodothermaceae bacterium]
MKSLNLLLLSLFLFFSVQLVEPASGQTGSNVPEWSTGLVWYQIFPERFHNGDPSNDPVSARINAPEGWKISPWTGDWYQRAGWEQRVGPRFYDHVRMRRYGGDLQGVIDKLDYLKDLGITAIYFNPIFDAVSMHKYDASHYHHIDRHFGPDPQGDLAIMQQEDPADPATWQWTSADRLFLHLLDEAKKRNIRVIIDGVWNHTGRDFWAFSDIRENGEQSEFRDWYKITGFSDEFTDGFDYEGWWGYKGLPEFTESGDNLHTEVKEHIFHVTHRWMAPDGDVSRGVDGWRLDVAQEVGTGFWREWHALVREINPRAITVAEIWDDAAREYIKDDLFSIVMNYRWTYAVHDYFIKRKISARDFKRRLESLRNDFPDRVNHAMQNLMDSHDTERLASMVVNRDRDFKEGSKIEDIGNTYNVNSPDEKEWDLVKLIALFQYMYKGSPMVYYGTEAGMWGADDPDDRKPMPWPGMEFDDEINHPWSRARNRDAVEFNEELHQYYKQLADIRNQHQVIQSGDFTALHAPARDRVFAFARHDGENNPVIVILNSENGEKTVDIRTGLLSGYQDGTLTDLVSGREVQLLPGGRIQATIGPVSGMVLVRVQ